MNIISILRSGTVAFALIAAVTAISPALAASAGTAEQSQPNRISSSGPYDGSEFMAATLAFN